MLDGGSATLVFEGETFQVDSPELIPLSTVETVFVPGEQRMHRIFGVTDVLRLRRWTGRGGAAGRLFQVAATPVGHAALAGRRRCKEFLTSCQACYTLLGQGRRDAGAGMSFEEKGTWLYLVLAIALPIVYFATILGQVSSVPVTEIDYQGLLIAIIGAAIGLAIVGMIAIAIASPADADKSDQRDKDINRSGEYVGGTVLAAAMIVPFGLAMAEAPQFWIANTMYLAFIVAAICGTTVKLVLYRRGF